MKKNIQILYMLALQFVMYSCNLSKPIEEIFPAAFPNSTGIMVSTVTRDDMEIYNIEPFPPDQAKRNHYDGRLKTIFKQLRNKTISAKKI